MQNNSKQISNNQILAIHCTDDSFGFAHRKNNNTKLDSFFINKFNHDLCNKLIIDFQKFISNENLQKVNKNFCQCRTSKF